MALSKLKQIERRDAVIDRVLNGERNIDIIKWLQGEYKMTYMAAEKAVLRAKENINKFRGEAVDQLLTLHLIRYEELYKLASDVGMSHIAIKALQGKEKIIGLHKDESYVKVNNEYIDATVVTPYNFDKLSEKENKRMQQLIAKMAV